MTRRRQVKEYRPREGARLSAEQAQVVGEELETLPAITAQSVVEAARPEEARLHPFFEWDDVRAAELYREEQARHLIRSVNVIFVDDGEERETQAFHLIEVGDERRYSPLSEVMDSAELQAQILKRARAELASWKARYSEYRHLFGPVMQAIEESEEEAHPQEAHV